MSDKTRRNFTQEFKIEAIKLVKEQGYSVIEASTNLGIGLSTLSKWINKHARTPDKAFAFPGKGHVNPHEFELKRLQKEVEKLKREREILKKALGYFAENRE
jgi:transposase